jgi:hypothetical protein
MKNKYCTVYNNFDFLKILIIVLTSVGASEPPGSGSDERKETLDDPTQATSPRFENYLESNCLNKET